MHGGYIVARLLRISAIALAITAQLLVGDLATAPGVVRAQSKKAYRFDFGPGKVSPGYIRVSPETKKETMM